MERRLGFCFGEVFLGNRHLVGCRDLGVYWQSGIGCHSLAEWRVGRQNTMISVAMLAWRGSR